MKVLTMVLKPRLDKYNCTTNVIILTVAVATMEEGP